MKRYFLIFIMLFLFILPGKVNALCSDAEIIRLQNIAKNVQYSYEYDYNKNKFIIIFNNLSKEIVLEDVSNKKRYNTNDEIKINDVNSGMHRYSIYAENKKCTNELLISKYITLPYYNVYYNLEFCKGIEEYSYCNKWLNNQISYDVWYSKVSEYKESKNDKKINKIEKETIIDKITNLIANIYINYYYIILPVIITVLCIIIYIKNKQNDLI